MALLTYLFKNFLTEKELLAQASISRATLHAYQEKGIMPYPSYKLSTDIHCDSFFGNHSEQSHINFYPPAYRDWLFYIIESNDEARLLKQAFIDEYKECVASLFKNNLKPKSAKVVSNFDTHVENEWEHFLNGIYGLCTKTGLVKDIAAKEVAIAIIDEITEKQCKPVLSSQELNTIKNAIKLLDNASSNFAPHERLSSSRYRCIDKVCEIYNIK